MAGYYDLNLASGASGVIPAYGSSCKVISAPAGPVQIKFDGGESFQVQEGQGRRMQQGQTFANVYLRNLSALTQTIVVWVDDGLMIDDRVTGTVAVIDTAKATTAGGGAFSGTGSNVAAAAQFGTVQLFNPSNSGKRLVVESVTVNNQSAVQVLYALGFGAVATQYTGGGTGSLANKMTGGPAAASLVNQKNDHGADPAALLTLGVHTGGSLVASTGQFVYTPKRPLVILPNYGFIVADRTANSQISVVFDMYEEAYP